MRRALTVALPLIAFALSAASIVEFYLNPFESWVAPCPTVATIQLNVGLAVGASLLLLAAAFAIGVAIRGRGYPVLASVLASLVLFAWGPLVREHCRDEVDPRRGNGSCGDISVPVLF